MAKQKIFVNPEADMEKTRKFKHLMEDENGDKLVLNKNDGLLRRQTQMNILPKISRKK